MPWTLTTPIDQGALSAEDIPEVRITRQMHDSVRKRITLQLEYGRTEDDGSWTRMRVPDGKSTHVTIDNNSGTDYDDFIAANQATYAAVKTALYDKLSTDGVVDAGSIT